MNTNEDESESAGAGVLEYQSREVPVATRVGNASVYVAGAGPALLVPLVVISFAYDGLPADPDWVRWVCGVLSLAVRAAPFVGMALAIVGLVQGTSQPRSAKVGLCLCGMQAMVIALIYAWTILVGR